MSRRTQGQHTTPSAAQHVHRCLAANTLTAKKEKIPALKSVGFARLPVLE
jgi:hypothetical protein